jgi:hypothetical protein
MTKPRVVLSLLSPVNLFTFLAIILLILAGVGIGHIIQWIKYG